MPHGYAWPMPPPMPFAAPAQQPVNVNVNLNLGELVQQHLNAAAGAKPGGLKVRRQVIMEDDD